MKREPCKGYFGKIGDTLRTKSLSPVELGDRGDICRTSSVIDGITAYGFHVGGRGSCEVIEKNAGMVTVRILRLVKRDGTVLNTQTRHPLHRLGRG